MRMAEPLPDLAAAKKFVTMNMIAQYEVIVLWEEEVYGQTE